MEKGTFTYHAPDGRGTAVGIFNNRMLSFGLAIKNEKDNFSRKLGRMIASGRAVKNPFKIVEVVDTSNVPKLFYETASNLVAEKSNEILTRVNQRKRRKG